MTAPAKLPGRRLADVPAARPWAQMNKMERTYTESVLTPLVVRATPGPYPRAQVEIEQFLGRSQHRFHVEIDGAQDPVITALVTFDDGSDRGEQRLVPPEAFVAWFTGPAEKNPEAIWRARVERDRIAALTEEQRRAEAAAAALEAERLAAQRKADIEEWGKRSRIERGLARAAAEVARRSGGGTEMTPTDIIATIARAVWSEPAEVPPGELPPLRLVGLEFKPEALGEVAIHHPLAPGGVGSWS